MAQATIATSCARYALKDAALRAHGALSDQEDVVAMLEATARRVASIDPACAGPLRDAAAIAQARLARLREANERARREAEREADAWAREARA